MNEKRPKKPHQTVMGNSRM